MSNLNASNSRAASRRALAGYSCLAAGLLASAGLALCLTPGVAADDTAKPGKKVGEWTMWGGAPDRNMVSDAAGVPDTWDVKTGKNIKWKAPLGSQTYGNPSVAGGRIFIGTNNRGEFRPNIKEDKGIVLCLDEKTGKMLWQATHDKLPTGRVNDWPEQGICSAVLVEGSRIYYVSNRCELVCADVEGFLDGENDGPYTDEKYKEREDGDFIWIYDMIDELDVFPHNLATSSPVADDENIYILTSNGVDEGHLDMPSPDAPAFVAISKKDGKLVWGKPIDSRVLHGQWSSPALGMVAGKPQVVFGGGDGVCYSFDPKTGERLWSFDLNPKDSEYILGGKGTRNEIISTPVIVDDTVFVAVGQDPEHGEGVGHFFAIDATKRGDITQSGRIWHLGDKDFNRTMSTCAVRDGLVYNADLSGFLYCIDQKTGKVYWKYDTYAAIWGSPFVVDGKVMLGDEEGELVILKHGKELKEIATIDMINSVYTTPVVANGVLYITNRNTLFAIEAAKAPQ